MKKSNTHIDLEKLEKKNFYSAPDGYFDKLPLAIQDRISKRRFPLKLITEIPINIKWMAASFLLLIAVFLYWDNVNKVPTYEDSLANVTDDEIIDYLFLADFSTLEIINTIDAYDSISFNETPVDIWMDELTDNELENILKKYDYDTSIHYY